MPPDITSLCESWRNAGRSLGFSVESPFTAATNEGKQVLCVAQLPNFGSPNGMIVGAIFEPTYEIDAGVTQLAKDLGKYCSFINAKIYEKYDQEVFKESLADWGFWGAEKARPSWLPVTQKTALAPPLE